MLRACPVRSPMSRLVRLPIRLLLLACVALAAGCASAPPAPPPEGLFDDRRFAAASEPVDGGEVFALSAEMQRYVREDMAPLLRRQGRQRGLLEALGQRAKLRLEYDAERTRNASEAFAARSGNCLALVVMTAAFAKALDLPIEFQSAYIDETWSRSGDLYLRSGHVNVTIGTHLFDAIGRRDHAATVDFLPPERLQGLRTRRIAESTVVAMFMNNRAVEALLAGRVDAAYWWAREAIRRDPGHAPGYNTLGVVYLRHGDLALADAAFRHLLAREPDNVQALSNLAQTAERSGRVAEAATLRRSLERLEPHPPFHFFELGRAALARGDDRAARGLFAREVARDPHYAEFHYWLGVANFRLGDEAAAREHLALAVEYSGTRRDRELYAAKLAWLRAPATQR